MGKVAICNVALGRLGHDRPIVSMSEQSRESELCNILYDDALDRCLESAEWSFSKRRKLLAEVAGTPPQPWGYQYALPAGAVRGLWIENTLKCGASRPDQDIPFTIELDPDNETKILYTDERGVCLVYQVRVTNTDLFSGLFRSLLSWELALDLRGPIAGKKVKIQEITQPLELDRQRAIALDFSSETEVPEPGGPGVAARQ